MANKHHSQAAEQHSFVSHAMPTGPDVLLGIKWQDPDDGKEYVCTTPYPSEAFTEQSHHDKYTDAEALTQAKTINWFPGIVIEAPDGTEDITVTFTNRALTIVEIRAVLANGASTPSVTWTIKHDPDRSAAGNEVVTSGTTTTSVSTGSDVVSFNDETVPADSFIWLETTAASGTVPELAVFIGYTVD